LSESNAKAISLYVLSLDGKTKTVKSRPVSGTYIPKLPAGDNEKGSFIFRAAYTDKGTKFAAAQTGENLLVLKSSLILPGQADKTSSIDFNSNRSVGIIKKADAYLGFNKIDLNGINEIELTTNTDGLKNSKTEVEVHLDSPDGKLIGKSTEPLIKLDEVTDQRDVFLVFKNTNTVDNKSTLRIRSIRFKE
jgi:cytochrome c